MTVQQLQIWAYQREMRLLEKLADMRSRRDNRRARDKAARRVLTQARLTAASRARYLLTLTRVRYEASPALNTAIAEQGILVRVLRAELS